MYFCKKTEKVKDELSKNGVGTNNKTLDSNSAKPTEQLSYLWDVLFRTKKNGWNLFLGLVLSAQIGYNPCTSNRWNQSFNY